MQIFRGQHRPTNLPEFNNLVSIRTPKQKTLVTVITSFRKLKNEIPSADI
jgi:hypothetical protein